MSIVSQSINLPVNRVLAGDVNTSSSTQGNITGLSWPVVANAVYKLSGVMRVGCNNTGGVMFFGTFPASTTYFIHVLGRIAAANALQVNSFNSIAAVPTATPYNTANSAFGQVYLEGTITTTAAGTVQLTFASTTNTQTSTIYQSGTVVSLERIA